MLKNKNVCLLAKASRQSCNIYYKNIAAICPYCYNAYSGVKAFIRERQRGKQKARIFNLISNGANDPNFGIYCSVGERERKPAV